MGERFQELVMMGKALRAKMDPDTIVLFEEYNKKLAFLVVDTLEVVEKKEEESGVTITVEAQEVK